VAETEHGSALPQAARVLITLAAAGVTLVSLSLARDLVGPFALAAVIAIVVYPVRVALVARSAPSWVATAVMVASAYAIIIVIGVLLVLAIVHFGAMLSNHAIDFEQSADDVHSLLASLGLPRDVAATATDWLSPEAIALALRSAATSIVSTIVALAFVFAYVLFMSADSASFAALAERFAATRGRVLAQLSEYSSAVRRYLLVNATFGAIVAVLDGLVLAACGVPAPLTWAVLAFVTNFIPNIGFVIGLVPPVVLALLTEGWQTALVVAAAYCVINVVLQTLVQPRFISSAVSLSLTLTFASVVLWTFVIGPIGAILAVPLTLFLRVLLFGIDANAGFGRWLTGDRRDVRFTPPGRRDEPPTERE